ncbi:S1 family peptidase [Streptomyces alboflavus]|uniref:S1 family peptidase n=1 Tax=Streptomyces alboflavus TaxID=67267 RepID=UPI0004C1FA23|nr:S1 family peptidase [Streptomyces alboflavus]
MRLRLIIAQLLCAALAALGLLAAPTATAAPAPASAQTAIRGGDVLYSASGRCTVAFNVSNGTRFYGIMGGHCGTVGTQWFADPRLTVPVGVTETVVFPRSSYALVRYTNTNLTYPSEIRAGSQIIRINRAPQPVVGQQICRTGPTTGMHCGTIQSLNATVTFPQGTVYGLIRTNVCAEPGDAGGPGFAGDAALGIVVGGSGNCSSGGTTFFQPLPPILNAHGLRVGYART